MDKHILWTDKGEQTPSSKLPYVRFRQNLLELTEVKVFEGALRIIVGRARLSGVCRCPPLLFAVIQMETKLEQCLYHSTSTKPVEPAPPVAPPTPAFPPAAPPPP